MYWGNGFCRHCVQISRPRKERQKFNQVGGGINRWDQNLIWHRLQQMFQHGLKHKLQHRLKRKLQHKQASAQAQAEALAEAEASAWNQHANIINNIIAEWEQWQNQDYQSYDCRATQNAYSSWLQPWPWHLNHNHFRASPIKFWRCKKKYVLGKWILQTLWANRHAKKRKTTKGKWRQR